MNHEVSISVIVIGYNIENFIARCLDSVFSQTYDDYEVIFVNDGSTDKTLDIAKEYLSSKVKYNIIDKENGGIISARKEGLKAAKGKYVLFVDGDDSIKPDMVFCFSKFINESDSYDIVFSDCYEEKNNGEWKLSVNDLEYGLIDSNSFLEGIMKGTIYHYMVSKLYRKSFLINSGYLDFPNVTVAEDLYSNSIFAVNHPKLLYFDYAGYYYHNNNSSVTKEGKYSLVDGQLITLGELKKYFNEHFECEYDDYISFQWYLFAFGYIQTRYTYDFKRYLVEKCRPYMNGIKHNSLYRNQKNDLSKFYGRTLLFFYVRIPLIAKLLDPLSKGIIDILHINYG